MDLEKHGADDERADDERADDASTTNVADAGLVAADGLGAASEATGWCDGCSGCDLPLLGLIRVSALLVVVAALLPGPVGTAVAGLGLRGYRRWLSRWAPRCPGTPSCSAYAVDVVSRRGARSGLRLAARRVARCGRYPAV
ncbi:membrane protein insertion efficiency factor YidD [Pseudonocardia sp. GCM10023141]|uniref:membrane protein insertion efficiency factor YidD n=1 Tax=Pseudonocardia sp. GCM10023141 TaxID=3252653 RepID=UPI0036D38998